jgi:hypothetical protein
MLIEGAVKGPFDGFADPARQMCLSSISSDSRRPFPEAMPGGSRD